MAEYSIGYVLVWKARRHGLTADKIRRAELAAYRPQNPIACRDFYKICIERIWHGHLSEQVPAIRLHLAPEFCGIAKTEITVGFLCAVLSGSYHHRHGQSVTEQQCLLL